MKYGMNYMGGKNEIADRIIEVLPSARCFVDLFAGGCAMSHCAMRSHKYSHIITNDITDSALFFRDVISGMYYGTERFVTREEFVREREKDPFVRIMYSFSNNLVDYLYGKEVENEMRLKHLFYFSVNGSHLKRVEEYALKYRGERLPASVERIRRLDELYKSVQHIKKSFSCEYFNMSYDEMQIPEDSIIYCDIPYRGTKKYIDTFDHEKFYQWALKQREMVYVSEYDMPGDMFDCVLEIPITSIYAGGKPNRKVERLFVPKGQQHQNMTLF